MSKKIALIVGSLRKESINRQLADAIKEAAGDRASFTEVQISEFPLFNQDLEADFPAVVKAQKDVVEAQDAVLFVSPDYNYGIPGPLKNGIDWISRPWGESSFADKPLATAGASIGPSQGKFHHVHVRDAFSRVGNPFFDADYGTTIGGELSDEQKSEIAEWTNNWLTWLEGL
ncbi:NAD(P)H-dependent oxidoreductase [Micrococcales bacterium 31B]|nr:NAD(P)H-dependent oxidoreductase [Micrococcales bacterium 31B]